MLPSSKVAHTSDWNCLNMMSLCAFAEILITPWSVLYKGTFLLNTDSLPALIDSFTLCRLFHLRIICHYLRCSHGRVILQEYSIQPSFTIRGIHCSCAWILQAEHAMLPDCSDGLHSVPLTEKVRSFPDRSAHAQDSKCTQHGAACQFP